MIKKQVYAYVAIGILLVAVCGLLYEIKRLRSELEGMKLLSAVELEEAHSGEADMSKDKTQTVTVYIHGAVLNPGIYTLEEGARVIDAADMAGLEAGAAVAQMNPAQKLVDGQNIYVPSGGNEGIDKTADVDHNIPTGPRLINLNRADLEELTLLPGIGEATAKEIIAYRNLNGGFYSIEEIQKVPGIGEKTFENLKEFITVIQ